MAGFLALDTESHCRAVMPRFSGGVHWESSKSKEPRSRGTHPPNKEALSKRMCCVENVKTVLKKINSN